MIKQTNFFYLARIYRDTNIFYLILDHLYNQLYNKIMSCEQKDEQFALHFLDCDCTCCGVRQRHIPSVTCNIDQSQFKQLVKDISKPRYALDCNCICGGNSSLKKVDSCPCPTNNNTNLPIQVDFSVDTGIKKVLNTKLSESESIK